MYSYFKLADKQRETAFELLKETRKLNALLLNEIISLEKIDKNILSAIKRVGYVPGEAMCIVIQQNVSIPSQLKDAVKKYLGVPLFFVIDTGSSNSVIRQAIGNPKYHQSSIKLDDNAKTALVYSPLTNEQENRVMLAQQIVNYHIIRE